MSAPSRPSGAPVQPTIDRTAARIESTMYVGILVAVIGVIVGLIMAVQGHPSVCAGSEGVVCSSHPYLAVGVTVALLSGLLGVVIGLVGWVATRLAESSGSRSASTMSNRPSAVRRTGTTSSSERKDTTVETLNLGTAEGLPPIAWAGIEDTIAAGVAPAPDSVNCRTTWLTTMNDDGTPHVTPVGAIWLDGAFWFQTGATRKGRNIARDPRCWISLSIRGADVVLEGVATHMTNAHDIVKAARGWADTGWPAELHESGTGITAPFNAPAQGPAPWNVYRIDARSATAVSTVEPGGLTRFRF